MVALSISVRLGNEVREVLAMAVFLGGILASKLFDMAAELYKCCTLCRVDCTVL